MNAEIPSYFRLNLKIALRDLLGDRRGFGIFIACIMIGVAAIAGVSSLSFSLAQGLSQEKMLKAVQDELKITYANTYYYYSRVFKKA